MQEIRDQNGGKNRDDRDDDDQLDEGKSALARLPKTVHAFSFGGAAELNATRGARGVKSRLELRVKRVTPELRNVRDLVWHVTIPPR